MNLASRKSTPYAAQVAAEDAGRKAMEHGMRTVEVNVSGPGSARKRAACAASHRFHRHLDPRRDADSAQWLPPAQAPPRLIILTPRAPLALWARLENNADDVD